MSKHRDSDKPAVTGSIALPKAGRGGSRGFLKEVQRELMKVDWPTPKETNRLTGIVFAVVFIAGAAISAMSFLSDSLVRLLQGKL